MQNTTSFNKSYFSTLLIGLIFSLGCECCCECKDEQVSTLTIPIVFFPTYTGRTCPIPIPGGALTGAGFNIIPRLTGDNPFYVPESYALWAEFESCCDNFRYSPEFIALSNAGTAYFYRPGGNKRVKYIFALNTAAGSTAPTIPIPTSSSGPSFEALTIKYSEPCMNTLNLCESPYPCSASTSYRSYYEARTTVPWSSAAPHSNVTTLAILMHMESQCNPPQGWLCGE